MSAYRPDLETSSDSAAGPVIEIENLDFRFDSGPRVLENVTLQIEEGDFVKAELEFKNVLQIDPKDAEARYMLGQTAERQQQWRRAFSAYSGALEVNPKHLNALAQGSYLSSRGRYRQGTAGCRYRTWRGSVRCRSPGIEEQRAASVGQCRCGTR